MVLIHLQCVVGVYIVIIMVGVLQKVFEVPSTSEQKKIPFARVNHAKYMVTDRVVYIGTLYQCSKSITSSHEIS